jgi:sugar phosphate isomerase/epimerase
MAGLGLAVQLYTLREEFAEDVEGTLVALAEAGVHEVELAGLYGLDGTQMRGLLDGAGLKACSAHVAFERFERELETVLDEARALGVETLVVPSVEAPTDAAEADALVARIVAAGAAVKAAGLGFAYHNHDFEFTPLDGGDDLWTRLVATGLELEPDLGWLRVSGRDPVAVLSELAGRCSLVHAKDVRRGDDGEWRDVIVGEGELDWPAITAAAAAAGARRLVVELDNPSTEPLEDVSRSLVTLRAALGG